MSDDPRMLLLLDELFASQSTPEEVCASCPELLPLVRQRWQQLCYVRGELDALFPPERDPDQGPPALPLDGNALPVVPGYEVEGVLGRGGMGIVFRARHLRLKRIVALKMVVAGAYAGPHERARFQREAEAVAVLRHPNVVQVYDIGESDGQPYFTMELVEGGSLAEKLAGTPLPAREAATHLATLAGAVHAAHQSGIVHRDLKPANVLLTAEGTPKISDFGLARRLGGEAGLTRTGTAVGTPSYMAPEQARGQTDATGPTADIYALGAILYELLTGRPPFRAETAAETVHQLLTQDPVPPSRLNGKVPRDLETICMKCLHKEPRLRYVSAAALADDLGHFLRGEAIAARPEGLPARLGRRIRRRPALSAALAVSSLLAVALAGGGAWTLSKQEAAKRAAEAEEAALERAADADLKEMAVFFQKSSWLEAKAARERASGRVGDRGSMSLHTRLRQGERDLKLAELLDEIKLGSAIDPKVVGYEKAFEDAGIGKIGDDPVVVAKRIMESNIRPALVNALDFWASRVDPSYATWLLAVARNADPDPQGWRDRFRDPHVRKNKKVLAALVDSAKVDDTPVNLLVTLGELLQECGGDAIPFLVKVQRRYPNDLWANFILGHLATTPADATRYYQAALAIRPGTPVLYFNLGYSMFWSQRLDDALYFYSEAVRLDPAIAPYRAGLGKCLLDLGRDREAHEQFQQGLALQPDKTTFFLLQNGLRKALVRQQRWSEAQISWGKALELAPSEHKEWYGYAELCLFLGRESEYCMARKALLATFSTSSDPYIAERTSRACMLLPASEKELHQAAALAEHAVAADPSKYSPGVPYFQFVRGLAEYRKGHFDVAITVMREEALRIPGPAPRLLLAMALHKTGQETEARKTLAAAMLRNDWRSNQVRDQDEWIFHVLRREAEGMILPNLPAFLEGKYQPRDNDERLGLLGVCQFTNRPLSLSRLYAAAFAIAPQLAEDLGTRPLAQAACAAALAGCGYGNDAVGTNELERVRWRAQARQWLREDLEANQKLLDREPAKTGTLVKKALNSLKDDIDLSCIRDPSALSRLPVDEQKECIRLWAEINDLLRRAVGGK
ncbi:serine/threonine-protein kinase [Fimbriiglobus ruber]|uniref:non-specific serine/threonine protein kinase n=1 Tax=Fimbriiglobus ruber TaxID=1908690 RepID=A0A225D6A5_9BACT|nr:serine/threonine-protein kinase [Fimbriiglobus ruber]OWK35174.1 Serine/threonine protein kinase PrkC, regulator of stationary phase [Fimbriiglobus ruber]